MATFEPPTYRVPFDIRDRFWSRFKTDVGKTVYKDTGGVWHTVISPDWNTLVTAAALPSGDTSENAANGKYVFVGGHKYVVSAGVAAELVAAGYVVT